VRDKASLVILEHREVWVSYVIAYINSWSKQCKRKSRGNSGVYINMRTARRKKLPYVYWNKVILSSLKFCWHFFVWKFKQANKTSNCKRKAACVYVTREPFQVTLYTDIWAPGKIVQVCVLCSRLRHRHINLWLSESYGNRAVWYVERLIGVWGYAVVEGTCVYSSLWWVWRRQN